MGKRALGMVFFICLVSCHKTAGLKSQASPKYKDDPIKFIYVNINDREFSFDIHEIEYCYQAKKHYETDYKIPVKTVKAEVYSEDGAVQDISPIIKTYTQEFDYPDFILKIPYQEGMESFMIFRLDEKGRGISYEIYWKIREEEKRERGELSRQELEEEKRLTEDDDRWDWEEKWDEKWEKWDEKWDKRIITEPLRGKLKHDYKTLGYINPCHYKIYWFMPN